MKTTTITPTTSDTLESSMATTVVYHNSTVRSSFQKTPAHFSLFCKRLWASRMKISCYFGGRLFIWWQNELHAFLRGTAGSLGKRGLVLPVTVSFQLSLGLASFCSETFHSKFQFFYSKVFSPLILLNSSDHQHPLTLRICSNVLLGKLRI